MPSIQQNLVRRSPDQPSLTRKTGCKERSLRIRLPRHTARASRGTILWIDDYELGLSVYKSLFEAFGFRVLTTSNPTHGLSSALSSGIDAVVVDYEMPEMDGGTVASLVKRNKPTLPVVMFSGSDVPLRVKSVVDGFCDKAGSHEKLLATLNRVLAHKREPMLQPRPLRPASQRERRAVA